MAACARISDLQLCLDGCMHALRMHNKSTREIKHLHMHAFPSMCMELKGLLGRNRLLGWIGAKIHQIISFRFTQVCMGIATPDSSSTGLGMHTNTQDVTTYAQGLSRQTLKSPSVVPCPQTPPMVAHNMTSILWLGRTHRVAIGGYKWEAMTWVIGHPRSSRPCNIVPPLLSGAAR